MEIEVSAEAKDKSLNRKVAITVVVLSVFMGLCGIKDGNIVQAMQQAQSASVDKWNEYQATKTKQHVAEASRVQIAALADPKRAAPVLAGLDADIAKYKAEAPRLAADAKAQGDQYDALNVHDDQFDASDAAVSTAISIAAVAALVESGWLLWAGWAFGAFGLFMGLCGFLGWGFHPALLSGVLG
ncbi:DUF4337 domain-containing protein [Sphingomonas sp. NIBR02145]|uniref:DUF4337 domain-containing protein n=1 Tax=Sphingomonas sp. NIBR02145 TaxID=3014784 RepID=UPI0022B2EC3A|nr:DUF4337 domain-containing protein [Sphingomonas sp. NIBR02145]WHU01196.1 DUF4337 domain-containing protein [Sphingomonas sp. NIBR02145]